MMNKYSIAPIASMALASSIALAQNDPGSGNIPAPGLFNSQITCSNNLPSADMRLTATQVAEGDTSSALDDAIGTGDAQITDQNLLNALGYVIPSAGNNCGLGDGEAAFMASTQGSVATDIAEGYSALRPAYITVYGDPSVVASTGTAGALHQARVALQRAEDDETTSEARLTTLRGNVERAETADTEARARFAEIAGGSIDDATVNPIYAAAIAEWTAESTVTHALANYNDAVGAANVAQTTADTLSYAAYVPLGDDSLVDDVIVNAGGATTVNLARLREYVNATGGREATVNADGVYDTSSSNFDSAGRLVAPNRLVDGELEAITASTQVASARTNRANRESALKALKTLQAENKNQLLQPVINEGVRRAQAEFDYYDTQLRNALADETNQNTVTVDNPNTPVDESAPFSIASRNQAYVTASNARVTAEAALRAAAADREAATQKVVDQFGSPASFYQQLIARRDALKAAADKAVTDAGASPSLELTRAAAAAATALTEAQDAQTAYQAIAGDPDGPIDDLVAVLLEADGDDGQALVDAISQTYGKTVENGDAIAALTADTEDGADDDGPVTANRKAIDSLTADTEDGADADGPVTANRKAIEDLTADTDDGAEADGPITANRKAIAKNSGRIDTLEQGVDSNTEMIQTNAGLISANAGNIATNAGNIVTNASFISQNAAHIAHNGARIDVNAFNIAQNGERIGLNTAAIGLNSGMIAENRNMIGELGGQLDAMRGGIAASIAMSRMPAIDGGISFGAGMYGGESAFAVGFALERNRTTFDIGLTSSGGEVGAGLGVGVKLWGN